MVVWLCVTGMALCLWVSPPIGIRAFLVRAGGYGTVCQKVIAENGSVLAGAFFVEGNGKVIVQNPSVDSHVNASVSYPFDDCFVLRLGEWALGRLNGKAAGFPLWSDENFFVPFLVSDDKVGSIVWRNKLVSEIFNHVRSELCVYRGANHSWRSLAHVVKLDLSRNWTSNLHSDSLWHPDEDPRTLVNLYKLLDTVGGSTPHEEIDHSVKEQNHNTDYFNCESYLVASCVSFIIGPLLMWWGWGWWNGIFRRPVYRKGRILATISLFGGFILLMVGTFGLLTGGHF